MADDTYNPAGSNKALELIGRHLAMFTDKLKVDGHLTQDDYTGLSREQIHERMKSVQEHLSLARKAQK
jgi:hypothetical protein